MPKVDIYLPTYKPQETHLRAAIDSILAQTEEDWHLYINDQKTDTDTKAIVEQYLADPRIHFNVNEDNPGIGANWNDCLQYGDAPVVQYMFQDDVWHSNYLQAGLDVLNENTDVGMVSLGHEYIFEGDIPTENVYKELKNFISWNLREGCHEGMEALLWWLEHGLHPNVVGEPMFVMLRRNVIEEVGLFREDMNQNLDSEYWARVLLKTNWFYQAGTYGTFRVHGLSASMQNYQAGKGIFDRFVMMQTIVNMLPKEHEKQGRKHLKKHLAVMIKKFIERYGGVHIRESEDIGPEMILMKHPLGVLKSVFGFIQRRSKRATH